MNTSQLRKMILVPENTPMQFQSTIKSGESHQSRLDQDMSHVLQRKDISIEEKWKLYQQALQRYLEYTSSLQKPITLPIIEMMESSSSISKSDNIHSQSSTPLLPIILQSVPKAMRNKTELLLKQLLESNKISWTRDGLVSIWGNIIPQSNIIDLINDVVRTRKQSKNPVGIDSFKTLLEEINIPREFIFTSTQESTPKQKSSKKSKRNSFFAHYQEYKL